MAESITFNNAVYIIPDVGESNWGQNLTNYFVAIPQGAYQASGGTLPLTADLNFGTNFGIFAKYLTSTTTHPSTTGAVRLANTESVSWRNAANSADLALAVNSSNQLTFGGVVIVPGTSPTFTNITLTNTTNQITLGTTNTVTLSSTAPVSSRTYTIPDAGGNANVVLDAGNYTIAGTWSFSNTITLASSKAIILTDNTTNTVTIQATNSTTSWTMKLPTTHGSANQFLQTDGAGNTTWASGGNGTIVSSTAGNLTLFPSTGTTVSDTYVQNAHNITIGIATQASRSAALAITIPNPGNAVTTANIVLDTGAYTISGAWTHSGVITFSAGAGAITMSSSTIAMGSNKITGLANGTASTDAAAFGQVSPLFAYRRPVLQYASGTVVNLETGILGTSGQATILFPDGTVISDSTAGHINCNFAQNASTGASPQSGLRTGSQTANTWYAIYAVKANSGANFVTIADTVLPIQANFATLNSNFGSNAWVYLGIVRNGNGLASNNVINEFYQAGNMTVFNNAYTTTGNGFTFPGIQMGSTGSGTSVTVSYVAGTGATNVPNNLTMLYWVAGVGALGATNAWDIKDATNSTVHSAFPGNVGVGQVNTTLLSATKGALLTASAASALDLGIKGFVDGALGVGPNPLL